MNLKPAKTAETVDLMKLDYVVLTMVDRDDLDDGGVKHVRKTIELIQQRCPDMLIEALVGYFRYQTHLLDELNDCGAMVLADKLETVECLTTALLPQGQSPSIT